MWLVMKIENGIAKKCKKSTATVVEAPVSDYFPGLWRNNEGESGDLSRDDDPLEQSRGCFENVHHDFSRRISDESQRELGRIMGEIADAEEKSVNSKEKGAMSKYFLRVLKRAEHVVMNCMRHPPA
ncbi:uncharacterized protein LOC111251950 isoform X3 [Varroa destructor]|uniref:Uncharacterized protein n=1 Tax=Varroa destructor TaxID=109461 RepID=A0A7M7KCK8_VARDE|nr:uncharacterized protein LOC111251950 isoform X3 [Varroa destructor]